VGTYQGWQSPVAVREAGEAEGGVALPLSSAISLIGSSEDVFCSLFVRNARNFVADAAARTVPLHDFAEVVAERR
jgi:hypothetical protein